MQENQQKGLLPDDKSQYEETFFIKRPVLSTVISLVIVLMGILAIRVLPIEQYPNLVPPVVSVTAMYPGATPETIAETVASPIEEEINGVDDMIYMSSVASSAGNLTINVSFEIGTDPDIATINVNNRVQTALTSLPEEVQRYGVTVDKVSSSILQFVAVYSSEGMFDIIYLSNYALTSIVDNLKRLKGVGDAQIMSSKDYSMRIWIDPLKLNYFQLTPTDISAAIQDQNAQYAAGSIGAMPSPSDLELRWQVNAQGRLVTPEEFENIIIRTNPDGGVLRLSDVARVELGAYTYDVNGRLNEYEMVPIAIYLAPGANALETSELVATEMQRLSKSFPHGIEYSVPYDTTLFVKISVEEVIQALIEAMVLVFIVVYLFLQNWRATLIPCIAVPISIVGTFAGMYAFGFSINTLTLFGLVLAIGIVVDDAIVVLENVERILAENKSLTTRQATSKAMREVTGPVIAIVLVLCSVFIPVAFLGGLAGEMYKQFAITICISVIFSGIVALTLTPALCVILLKPHHHEPLKIFVLFNKFFDMITNGFTATVKGLIKSSLFTLAIFGVLCYSALHLFSIVPTELVPDEDQGFILALIQAPEGTALGPMDKYTQQVAQEVLKNPAVLDVVNITGVNLINMAVSTNAGALFIVLKDWDEREEMGFVLDDFIKSVYMIGLGMPEVLVLPFNPPPISGMSNTGGFEMYIQSQSGDVKELSDVTRDFIAKANQAPELSTVSSTFSITAPRLFIELNRENARALEVNVSDVFNVLAASFGTMYVNDFNYIGRTYKVIMQAEDKFRLYPDDISNLYVRNAQGNMIPLTSLVTVSIDAGPQTLERFNAYTSSKVTGNPAAGYSSGQANQALERIAAEVLPAGYSYAWTGTTYQEIVTGGTNYTVFALAAIMILLILAAQYERWTLPLSVLSAVPFALFGAICTNWLLGFSNGVYTQVAIITLMGLSAKNAILIVEFAAELYKGGMSAAEAAAQGAKLRFRPIIMTSLAFTLGCVPLAISTGAGGASRQAIGVTVVGGMLVATILAPLVVPYFFTKIMTLSEKFSKKDTGETNEKQ